MRRTHTSTLERINRPLPLACLYNSTPILQAKEQFIRLILGDMA